MSQQPVTRHVVGDRKRLVFVTVLIGVGSLSACSTSSYEEPKLPDQAIAIVEVGSTALFSGTTPLAMDQIDGADGGFAYDQLLPLSTQEFKVRAGTHSFVLDAPATKGLFSAPTHNERFQITATLLANKSYRFVGRREPITAKGLVGGILTGDMPVHVELVNETDGGRLEYVTEVPLGGLPGVGPQPVAAYSGSPEAQPLPPPSTNRMTYDHWEKEQRGPTSN